MASGAGAGGAAGRGEDRVAPEVPGCDRSACGRSLRDLHEHGDRHGHRTEGDDAVRIDGGRLVGRDAAGPPTHVPLVEPWSTTIMRSSITVACCPLTAPCAMTSDARAASRPTTT